jgi:hypothetical protein
MAASTKAHGSTTTAKATAMKSTKTATITKDNLKITKLMEKAPIFGQMKRYLKESGSSLKNMGSGSGKGLMETAMPGSGERTWWMAMGCMSGPMATSMKVNGG